MFTTLQILAGLLATHATLAYAAPVATIATPTTAAVPQSPPDDLVEPPRGGAAPFYFPPKERRGASTIAPESPQFTNCMAPFGATGVACELVNPQEALGKRISHPVGSPDPCETYGEKSPECLAYLTED